MIQPYFKSAVDLILPRFCISCEKKLDSTQLILCESCLGNLEFVNYERIMNEFQRKFQSDKIISDFCSVFLFSNNSTIQKLIHSLKYDQNYHIAKYLGGIIYTKLINKLNEWNADIIMPVPLHALRKAERGFNQAKELAKIISRKSGIKCMSNILRRVRYTDTQTKFSLEERKKNISNAFSVGSTKNIKNKRIIIIDDVITTGATITECASLLKKQKAADIFAISAAIAE